ncbi:MAG TPA: bifunctional serine/threonine-protein kinase/formylglycine-generating enzyme family protein [Polyangiaceae bacterium]|nr:bifunctional serine/threonine-protein kinase/formylglycine-generating enzyme family protein [Polyangiaceae bacterium]
MSAKDPLGIAGQTIAEKYRIEKLVGEGGFAVVYRATHTIWNKPVAIKFFNGLSNAPVDQRDQFRDAFIQEGALLTELSSHTAGIVQARDVGTYTSPDGQWMPYMVLEWLEGKPLDELLESERAAGMPAWGLPEIVSLLGQAANALDVAHGKGIAHRDIKPANLFVLGEEARSGKATVKVLDFGVAKMMSDNTQLKAALAKTGMGITSFTPQYGAPEQFNRSYGATGPWTDVYALALVAVEMLTGKVALDGDDLIQLAFASGNPEKRPTPRGLGAAVSDPVERVFQKALAVKPDDRYARAKEFWRDLEAAQAGSFSDTVLHPGVVTGELPAVSAPRTQPTPMGVMARSPEATTSSPSTISTRTPGKSNTGAIVGVLLGLAALGGGAVMMMSKKPAAEASKPEDKSAAAAAATPSAEPPASAAAAPATSCPAGTVLIPAGQFFMGSDAKDALPNQKPSHNVTLNGFCMDLYEVTAAQYLECTKVGKCKRATPEVEWDKITPADKKTYSALCTLADPEKSDHPVNCINWDMANTYCKNNDKRLPTEAEWEYATRGPDGRVYPWGDEAPTAQHLNACGTECLAWAKQNKVAAQFPGALYQADDGFATTAPVGKFPAGRSRFGPYDVVGNVWEWVADWEGAYQAADQKNPTGPDTGQKRIIRGGAWNGSYPEWLHPAFRYAQDPKSQSHGVGFRCAKSI